MNVLAVETSWEKGSVALFEDGDVIGEQELETPHAHGRDLAPAVLKILKRNSSSPDQVNLICVDVGPGSYTGLRVGVSFVKTLAYAEDIPVTAVTSSDAIAAAAPVNTGKLTVVIDAQWNEVYVTHFREKDGNWERASDVTTASPQEVADRVDEETMVLGNGIPPFEDVFSKSTGLIGSESHWNPDAKHIGQIGLESFRDGEEADLFSLQPLYLRPTQADVDRN